MRRVHGSFGRWSLFVALSWMAATACVHEPVLIPAPGAALSQTGGANATHSGVTVDVRGDAWKSDPKDLARILTPVLIVVANESGRPLQIRYSDFDLVGESGFRYAALPPFQPMGSAYGSADQNLDQDQSAAPALGGAPPPARGAPPPSRRFGHRHFFVAPYLSPYYYDYGVYPYPFAFDPFYWGQYYAVWVQPLPTRAMLDDALPEGVLQQHGEVAGFVYFQNVTPREGKVTFVARLVDANTNEDFGEVQIPLVTSQD
ncbi:hypothetical protein [Vulgatibacter incomptus]|uniref:Lipoprotein n=1 Tax=Vulgatibacter incomptus TaxID=1391653 RepID=A0A0K1P8D1_9BACT|nr:hypothetical protein [Vulgatibacter incomptus]AKU89783.1 hypothetical protein AKJ08_0170 [Vulgatibacter incomptus]